MNISVIGIDVDGVVADLHTEWIRRYNRDYNDNISTNDITDWHMEKCIKPSCGQKIYEYLRNPELYHYVLPISGAVEGVKNLREILPDTKFVFVSSCGENTFDQKIKWLVDYGFLPQKGGRQTFVGMADKSLLRADILIDDHGDNITNFHGIGILLDRPYNRLYNLANDKYSRYVAHNWEQVISTIKLISHKREVTENDTRRSPIPCFVS